MMGHNFKEVASIRTDKKKFDNNYDRIFGKNRKEEDVQEREKELLLTESQVRKAIEFHLDARQSKKDLIIKELGF